MAIASGYCPSRPLPATAVDDTDGRATTVAFTHCPYRELAEAHPELVCQLHRGLVEGFVTAWAGCGVDRFHALVDRSPCQVDLVLAATDPESA